MMGMTATGTATDDVRLRQFLLRLAADPMAPADFADPGVDPARAISLARDEPGVSHHNAQARN
jgi:hypothetical protein